MTTTTKRQKLMLHSCPRCRGDLLFDSYEEDFVCLQCGRHVSTSAVMAGLNQAETAVAVRSEEQSPALAA